MTKRTMKIIILCFLFATLVSFVPSNSAFSSSLNTRQHVQSAFRHAPLKPAALALVPSSELKQRTISSATTSNTKLYAVPDLDVVALVAGQETYGFSIVILGEAIYSFLQAPSFDNAKVLVPGILGAVSSRFLG